MLYSFSTSWELNDVSLSQENHIFLAEVFFTLKINYTVVFSIFFARKTFSN